MRLTMNNTSPNLRTRPLSTISYPIIILNDFKKIFRVNIGENKPLNITDNYFQLEINYAYLAPNRRNINEYFLIDVVDFSHLDYFLGEIETKDVDAIKECCEIFK